MRGMNINMAKIDISAETAEKERKNALNQLLAGQNKVKLADLDKKFVVIKEATDFGGLFEPIAENPLVFGIVSGNIYRIDVHADKFASQVADPTKGVLVVELDQGGKKINWLQDHIEQQPFETFNSLRSSAFTGDAGYPLIQALEAHIHGTYNISGYDSRLVTAAELIADLKENAASASSDHSAASSAAHSATPISATPASSASHASSAPASASGHPASSASSSASSASSASSSASHA